MEQPSAQTPPADDPAAILPVPGKVFDALLAFDGPPGDFAMLLLASIFSSRLVMQAVVFRAEKNGGTPVLLAAFPPLPGDTAPDWLKTVVAILPANDSRTKIIPRSLPGGKTSLPTKLGITSLDPAENVYLAFEMKRQNQLELPAFMLNLDIAGALWRAFSRRAGRSDDAALARALAVLSAVNPHKHFLKFAMSLCNDLAARFGCDRVSLGILRGRYVRAQAISHTEKFGKGMELVQMIEAAMEECLDQDAEILFPAEPGSPCIHRAASELSGRFDSHGIVSIPVRDGERPAGVLTLERSSPFPPDWQDVRLLRLTADLVAPRLLELFRNNRWFGARFACRLRDALGVVVGSRHAWAKLAALLCLGAITALCFVRGTYSVESTFVTRPVTRRVLAAPYDGFLAGVHIRPGEEVIAGETLMAELETAELTAQLAMKKAEMAAHRKDAALARREGKIGQEQAAAARAEMVGEECGLLRGKLTQASLYPPLTGIVLSGDWTTRVGTPVKLGETLFEIAPIDRMEADLYVPEDDIADVREGQTGSLAAAGRPDEFIRFAVVRVTPLAELVKQKNVFRVRVRLVNAPAWILPGLEGVAKVDVEERLLIRIWSRRAVNWLKMKLWLWTWW